MDPKTPNEQPITPAAPVAPIQTPQPLAPSQPVSAQPASAPNTPLATLAPTTPVAPLINGDMPKKSKKPVIIAIVVAAVVLLIILAIFVILPAMSLVQAKSRADGFMKDITTGNVDDAMQYIRNGGSADDKAYFVNVAKNIKGSFAYKASTSKDAKFYALYKLTGGENISARTEFSNDGGKWYLDSFDYDNKELDLVPTGAAKIKATSAPATSTATKMSACLTQDDYKWFNYDKKPSSVTFDSTYNPAKYTNNLKSDMFFEPDSTKETSLSSVYDNWADFGTRMTAKQWTFRLEGSTYGTDAASIASKKLASDRAEKVKAALVSRGVAASKIIIDPPHDYGNEKQLQESKQIYRSVQVIIDPTCI